MNLSYSLAVADHLAWYDCFVTIPKWRYHVSSFPVLGRFINRRRRWLYARQITSSENSNAIGPRSLDVSNAGLREFTEKFDFRSSWKDIVHFEVTDRYVFLAHEFNFAHVIPPSAFSVPEQRSSFISLVQGYLNQKESEPNQAPLPTPASVTPAANAPVAPDAGAAEL